MLKLKQNFNKNKKIYIILIPILSILLIIFFINFAKNNYKTIKSGNNISNKTLEEVEQYILNISSYKATMEVTIESNKNTNKYILSQTHTDNEDTQEVLEPENIRGLKITYKDGTLEIKNTILNLSKIYNNYPYIESSNLWLNSFITEYKEQETRNILKENEEIILKIETKNDTKIRYKELYIDENTGKPTKLLLKDTNKKEVVYILYTEIELNY